MKSEHAIWPNAWQDDDDDDNGDNLAYVCD
jgi:hypothetical protein